MARRLAEDKLRAERSVWVGAWISTRFGRLHPVLKKISAWHAICWSN